MIIPDAREYIIPIFSMKADGNGVYTESRIFLGTAFFVTNKGDAITANHILIPPTALEDGRRIVAIVLVGGVEAVCWINHAASFPNSDFALIKVNLDSTVFLPISIREVIAGDDVQMVGIPSHEIHAAGKEMRILKGHVTLAGNHLELSFPIPPGMSGSPIIINNMAVGYANGSLRTEEVEDSYEEIEKISPSKEVIRKTKIVRVTEYGKATPFSVFATATHPILDNKTLIEFIQARNEVP